MSGHSGIRGKFALAALTLVALAAVRSAAAGDGVQVTPVGRLQFPERGFLVDLPRHLALEPGDVRVLENGRRVADASLVPVGQAGQRLGLMLVIDASNSMRGAPLRDAFAAGRQLASRLGGRDRIGVIAFHHDARVLLEPTQDAGRVEAVLRRPPRTGEGTRIYDALARALTVIRAQRFSASTIVLISDGADIGSKLTAASALEQAGAQHVRIFTVGLRSTTFKSLPLQALASASGGSYAEASSSSELAAIYDAFGTQLASEYLLRYHSGAKPGADVHVRVEVAGGAASYDYRAGKPQPIAPFHRSPADRFWAWHGAFAVVGSFAMLLVFAAVLVLLRGPRSTLRERVAEFVSMPGRERTEEPQERRPSLSQRVFGRSDLSRTRWWASFKEELEIAEIRYPAEQIAAATLVATVLVFLLLLLVLPVFSVFAFGLPLVTRALCRRQLLRVRDHFAEQLPDNLQVLASALRAGHSFVGALSVVAADADAPSRREFQRVVADEQLGIPVERSLREVARRMASPDLEQVALVAELQRQTGGNMAEVLDRVVETIRGRFDLRRLVKTLTAQGRMARWILSLLPVALGGFITLMNPGYMRPLFSSVGGQLALALAGLMIISGSLVIKRIVNIKV